MSLSYQEVAEILKIIDASNMEEVILETDGVKLIVRRGAETTRVDNAPTSSASVTEPTPARKPTSIDDTSSGAPVSRSTPTPEVESTGKQIVSPMVGTFYRCPSPGEAPFVEVGSEVKVGDPVCMIEVMKLYTTIEATIAGVIGAILAEDATLVEFNQPLFTIE